jgi:hypothetical protein
MSALGWKAAVHPGRMSALTDTGRSEALRRPEMNGNYRPEAEMNGNYRPEAAADKIQPTGLSIFRTAQIESVSKLPISSTDSLSSYS